MKYWMRIFTAAVIVFLAACQTADNGSQNVPAPTQTVKTETGPKEVILTPNAIPGAPRSTNDEPTGGYAPSHVQAQLKIDVKDGTKEVKVIRDTSDPFVITKPYVIRNADPYAVRNYLCAAVGAKSVRTSPAEATAVKYSDGTGVLLVSAEAYRFTDSPKGKGIDAIVAALDRPGLTFISDADTHVYFPRYSRATNLRDMLIRVGSSELDPQFEISPSVIMVDGELNALVVQAPEWTWKDMCDMLIKYDRPIPEMRLVYKVMEIYAENDDRIGVDFQSWKNNEGVDLFSTGAMVSRNWGTFFTSGVQKTGNNKVSYWNFNPKWNTRYLDFLTSIGKAKVLAQGQLVAQNRITSNIQVNSGFFYDRIYYTEGATSIAEGCTEFAYTEPNPDAIKREAYTKIMPANVLNDFFSDAGSKAILKPIGYTMRVMGTQTGTNTYGDVTAYATGSDANTDTLAKFLTGYVKADGTKVVSTYYNTNGDNMSSAIGQVHGGLQYPMVTDGFQFDLKITPIVTGQAATVTFALNSISLLGWNSDGSARTSESTSNAMFQLGYEPRDFVIGGLKKSESVRSTAGLPFFKDIPVLGRAFSTESESIKQSQLVLIARAEYVMPNDFAGADIKENLGKIVKGVNKGMTSRVGNMFFSQYWLDSDRKDRNKRLDDVGNIINDEYQEYK